MFFVTFPTEYDQGILHCRNAAKWSFLKDCAQTDAPKGLVEVFAFSAFRSLQGKACKTLDEEVVFLKISKLENCLLVFKKFLEKILKSSVRFLAPSCVI